LVPLETQEIVLESLRSRARQYAEASRSANTIRAYEGDLEAFCVWCRERGITCLPADAETVSLFVAWCAEHGLKASTIERRLAAISVAHGTAGYESPTVMPTCEPCYAESGGLRARRRLRKERF